MSLHQRGLEAGDNFTKSTSWSKYKLSRNQIISKSFLIIYSILNHSCAYKQIIENFAIQKEPDVLCDQNPEQSNRNHSDDEQKGKKKWKEREGEEKKEELEEKLEEEQEMEEENEEQHPQERLVSKPLMDTLWATFKLNKCPTMGDSRSLAFEFNMTVKQIKQWFHKRRKKYNKVMYKRKHKKRPKR
ncbi:nanog neighbor homeobox-like [Lynx pardinus]|uniref:Nanog neighbor homeobox-like n=1 Tax=Lynx pardinus TaxID=191816 RepID=A0A485P1J4_LYNPA|nr:nanog neighbor homeobox-like [Lynx pardinus]